MAQALGNPAPKARFMKCVGALGDRVHGVRVEWLFIISLPGAF